MIAATTDLIGRDRIQLDVPDLTGKTVLVTGSTGFVGSLVGRAISERGGEFLGFDLPECDVLDIDALRAVSRHVDHVIHLAACKHAPLSEERPGEVAHLNIVGTANVVEVFGARTVLASTCKASDPFGPYGASKFVAERITLNAGGTVLRYVNVVGSTLSVVPLWAAIPDGPLPVTDCLRIWMSPEEAIDLTLASLIWPSGRYALDVAHLAEPVIKLMERAFPGRDSVSIPLRRGDRPVERLVGEHEVASVFTPGVIQIRHLADSEPA
jgi:FlaA1/EpsC-like NDP-sugar epimerase